MTEKTILLADSSSIIRSGLMNIISDKWNYELIEIEDINHLKRKLKKSSPDLLIIGSDFADNRDFITSPEYNISKKQVIVIKKECAANQIIEDNYTTLPLITSKAQLVLQINEKLNPRNDNDKKNQNELSKREKTIIREIALGRTSKEIADRLFISTHTVLTHRKNINKKLEIKTASGLTVYAILNDIVNLDELENAGL